METAIPKTTCDSFQGARELNAHLAINRKMDKSVMTFKLDFAVQGLRLPSWNSASVRGLTSSGQSGVRSTHRTTL